jgi:hypothetical protein
MSIFYSGQLLDFRTSLTLARFNVPSEWQGAQSQCFLRPLPPRLDIKFGQSKFWNLGLSTIDYGYQKIASLGFNVQTFPYIFKL